MHHKSSSHITFNVFWPIMGHNLVPECGIMILFGWFHYSDIFFVRRKDLQYLPQFPHNIYPLVICYIAIEHGYL